MPLHTMPPAMGLPFISVLVNSRNIGSALESNVEALAKTCGSSFHKASAPLSDKAMEGYYRQEMGEGLARFFLIGEKPISKSSLIDLKLCSMDIELQTSLDSKRSINLDPGMAALDQLTLTTAKPYSHRVYIRDGVYIDLCAIWSKGQYHAMPWCYPDYAAELDFFASLRQKAKGFPECHLSAPKK